MANNSRLNLAAKCGDTDRKAVVTGRAIPRSTGQRSKVKVTRVVANGTVLTSSFYSNQSLKFITRKFS